MALSSASSSARLAGADRLDAGSSGPAFHVRFGARIVRRDFENLPRLHVPHRLTCLHDRHRAEEPEAIDRLVGDDGHIGYFFEKSDIDRGAPTSYPWARLAQALDPRRADSPPNRPLPLYFARPAAATETGLL